MIYEVYKVNVIIKFIYLFHNQQNRAKRKWLVRYKLRHIGSLNMDSHGPSYFDDCIYDENLSTKSGLKL